MFGVIICCSQKIRHNYDLVFKDDNSELLSGLFFCFRTILKETLFYITCSPGKQNTKMEVYIL